MLAPGLNVVTGESGAGKSVLVTCLGQLLGAPAVESCIRPPASSAIIEGTLHLPANAVVLHWPLNLLMRTALHPPAIRWRVMLLEHDPLALSNQSSHWDIGGARDLRLASVLCLGLLQVISVQVRCWAWCRKPVGRRWLAWALLRRCCLQEATTTWILCCEGRLCMQMALVAPFAASKHRTDLSIPLLTATSFSMPYPCPLADSPPYFVPTELPLAERVAARHACCD